MLKPTISSGCPLNKVETLLMTPGVSMLLMNTTKNYTIRTLSTQGDDDNCIYSIKELAITMFAKKNSSQTSRR